MKSTMFNEDEMHEMVHKVRTLGDRVYCGTPTSPQQDIDLQRFLRFNTSYVRDYVKRTGVSRTYFEYGWHHYGSLVNGQGFEEKLQVDNHERLDDPRFLLSLLLPPAFALKYAIDCEKPDRIVGILNGALGFVATAEFLGYRTESVEAHPRGSLIHEKIQIPPLRREHDDYQEHFSQPVHSDEKILLLEDTSDGNGTYRLVKNELVKRHNLDPANISLFLGWPGHGYKSSKDQRSFHTFLKERAYFLPAEWASPKWRQQDWRIFQELHQRGNFQEKLEEFIQQIQGSSLMREGTK